MVLVFSPRSSQYDLIFVVCASAVEESVLLGSVQAAATTVGGLKSVWLKRQNSFLFSAAARQPSGVVRGITRQSESPSVEATRRCFAAYVLWLSFHESTLWAEPAMGTASLLECFARSRRARWRPRPLLSTRPFQPVRCHPETAPPRWQCTYGHRDGRPPPHLLCKFAQQGLTFSHFKMLLFLLSTFC